MLICSQELTEYTSININTRHPNYADITSYDFGEVVFYAHYYWKSIIDANIGNEPLEDSVFWLKWDISNRYAQVDLRANTKTVWDSTTALNPADDALITVFPYAGFDTIAFGNIVGTYVTVNIKNNAGDTIWTTTKSAYYRGNIGWYSYFFSPYSRGGGMPHTYFQIPKLVDATEVEVTIISANGVASVGYMVAGKADFAGYSQYGLTRSIADNSLVEIDNWGITTVKKRIASRSMDVTVEFPAKQIIQKEKIAIKHQGEIVLFIADENSDEYEHLLLLGYIESFNVPLPNSVICMASYSVKEMI